MQKQAMIDEIYRGNLDIIKTKIPTEKDAQVYMVSHLMPGQPHGEYWCHLIPLVMIGEANHPGQFPKYKKIIDHMLKQYRIDFMMYNANHCVFFRYDKDQRLEEVYPNGTPLASLRVRQYLQHVKVRQAEPRVEVSHLLWEIPVKSNPQTPADWMAIRVVRRMIVANYRRQYPRENEG